MPASIKSHRGLFWLIALAFAAHNLEEAFTLRRYLADPPEAIAWIARGIRYEGFLRAIGFVTLVPLAIALWAHRRPFGRPARIALILTQMAIAMNAASHVSVALATGAHVPGLMTALAINVPVSICLFRRTASGRWLSRAEVAWALLAALVLPGPVLLGLLPCVRSNRMNAEPYRRHFRQEYRSSRQIYRAWSNREQ